MLKGVEIYLCLTMPNDPKRQQTEVGLCLDTGKIPTIRASHKTITKNRPPEPVEGQDWRGNSGSTSSP